ncbi:MAG: hypothetical protein Phog2KO_50970 [Phototrophicaceae bacterium]
MVWKAGEKRRKTESVSSLERKECDLSRRKGSDFEREVRLSDDLPESGKIRSSVAD